LRTGFTLKRKLCSRLPLREAHYGKDNFAFFERPLGWGQGRKQSGKTEEAKGVWGRNSRKFPSGVQELSPGWYLGTLSPRSGSTLAVLSKFFTPFRHFVYDIMHVFFVRRNSALESRDEITKRFLLKRELVT